MLFKKRKNELEDSNEDDRIFLKVKIDTFNLNNGDEATIKGLLGFNQNIKLGEAFDIIDRQFNLNKRRGDYAILTNNIDTIWKQHEIKDTRNINVDLYTYKLKELKNMFDLTKFTFNITLGGGGGGDCGCVRGMHFIIHAGETKKHHTKHIHVKKSGEEISVSLESLEVIEGKFKNKKDEKRAVNYISRNQKGLINEWDLLQNGITHKSFRMLFDCEYDK